MRLDRDLCTLLGLGVGLSAVLPVKQVEGVVQEDVVV